MRVRVRHETRYHFDAPALLGPHVVRLHPAEHARTPLLSYNLTITPAKHQLRWQHDPWGNRIARATFEAGGATDELAVIVDAAFDIRPINPFDFFVEDSAREVPFAYEPALRAELAPFFAPIQLGPRGDDFVRSLPKDGYVTSWLVDVNAHVARAVRYVIRDEAGIRMPEETLEIGSGSCRDSAHLLVAALRARGIAARFVSGYLVQLTDEGDIPGEKKGVAQDVVDLHAWAEAYVPGAGWVGLDATSGLLAGEGHVPLAGTADPALAAPIVGTASTPARLSFSMQIVRLGHEPSPQRPYTEAQWSALVAKGADVDAALERNNITLTMGGEPAWTSREHPALPEWNTEALGATKWQQGARLARELRERIGQGALLMQRMGKLYPGESLPRWALHLVWRADGRPLWHDPARLALPGNGTPGPRAMATEDDARRLASSLARRLGLVASLADAPQVVIPAYEDPWPFLGDEQNLPLDVDPLATDLESTEARRTLSRVLGRGLGRVVGFATPIGRDGARWVSSKWSFRRGHLFLIPGDSPMGLRLPLDRLQGASTPFYVRDTSVVSSAEPLGPPAPRMQREIGEQPTDNTRPSARIGVLRTSLCTEVRDGVVHVFLPPVGTAEDFIELVATLEDACVETGVAVRVEGYAPPSDPRLGNCLVTPDPGVIEVNLPVTRRFAEYVPLMELVTDAARHAGLTTQKFQLDGREVGPGGGHHLTLGGPSAPESPFLQRPDLLASLLSYLVNHPSLSYLFAGLFVGPTSQAPRLDEARHDALYELEIALARVPRADRPNVGPLFPWLVDRLFRNLLADVSGNTHRTELCIDKLWDPSSAAGRQGIVELRAFEMPSHERLACAQMLLVRSLVAMFAERPYDAKLVRWGSRLHDQFMLPHFLWADFESVLGDLARAGLALDPEWYRPFVEQRCPVLGSMTFENVTVEIRMAIEPWPVLAELAVPGGTSRYVDSSLERVQVRVDGLTDERHVVTVNGLMLPLRPTGRAGEAVCGVRFRAWQPPHCLQPTIGVHHPLRFDLVDTWAERSLGACTHHVWHPEGRAYDEPPLTRAEAAARRAQRFTAHGHAPFPIAPARATPHPEQPYTLDLRHHGGDRRVE